MGRSIEMSNKNVLEKLDEKIAGLYEERKESQKIDDFLSAINSYVEENVEENETDVHDHFQMFKEFIAGSSVDQEEKSINSELEIKALEYARDVVEELLNEEITDEFDESKENENDQPAEGQPAT